MKVKIVAGVLEANDRIAANNRRLFDDNDLFVINLMSSPGAGKTTLLEKTITALAGEFRIGVIEGDIATDADARRIDALGVPVVQINTGGGCHLDGNMVRQGMDELPLSDLDILIIENVGNLVCPAEFNVGEDAKIMILSTTEGADKPLKYPLMFQESSVLLLNKMDLLPYTDFDLEKARKDSLMLNGDLEIIEVSCRTGDGLETWLEWMRERVGSRVVTA